ncbi:hypothetical protein EMIHUDRAFT_449631 [Emiliania huxleyi CCMP1516]|uniref:DUF1275 domain-containing protein n=2 Tax=Emiliania huxleyi TaxID=2903 RepID=A0A0D3K5I1_EMIH1|nr:hypothetical protein EMIHUDRAFT_449631 [Emiliania huxleyi CCMP1516]EOD31016.1 hypothetical protein EMIHUDRAFT_449631 [Emiliania huxleyi CCMP1516]|eukprot:XP_005783445.1 hypothetical protein EMIHUDRAFT_449631 [Emiliania huxleyi CCMP1516]
MTAGMTAASAPAAVVPNPASLVTGLAFTGGWVDVFVWQTYGCYANMMTGNLLRCLECLTALRWALIASYVGGFGAFRVVDLSRRRRRTLSSVAPAVFALFALADLGLRLSNGSRWSILLLGVGSGVVNAASADSTGAVTCMVTGHLGRIARSLGDAITPL